MAQSEPADRVSPLADAVALALVVLNLGVFAVTAYFSHAPLGVCVIALALLVGALTLLPGALQRRVPDAQPFVDDRGRPRRPWAKRGRERREKRRDSARRR